MTTEPSDILPLHLFIERARHSSLHHGSRLGRPRISALQGSELPPFAFLRDIQLSQMEGSHVPDNIELGTNLMPPREAEATSTLDVLWPCWAVEAAMSLELVNGQF